MESRRLAAWVARVRHSLKPGDPFPDDLRRALARWAAQERTAGRTWSQISDQVGVSSTSVRNWIEDLSRSGGFHQLEVVDGSAESAPAVELQLTTPNGYVVTGSSVEQLLSLLLVLG